MGTLLAGMKEIFNQTPQSVTHIPTCASDGTPTGRTDVANLASVLGGTSTALPNNADLNNYRTPGLYTFSATSQSIANAPTGLYSCIMRVSTMTGQVVWQEILSGGGILYHRSYGVSSQTWNPWVRNDNYGTTSLSELASALGGNIWTYKKSIPVNTATTVTEFNVTTGLWQIAPSVYDADGNGTVVKMSTDPLSVETVTSAWYKLTISVVKDGNSHHFVITQNTWANSQELGFRKIF